MANDLSDVLKASIKGYLVSVRCNVDEVQTWNEVTEWGGYCETCSYETTTVDIGYTTPDGTSLTYSYYGKFGELLEALLAA